MASGMRMRADDNCTIEEQQLFNNLCLLGLAGSGAKSLAAGVELNKYTFRKPSTKVLEAVLYQLYALVCGDAAAQKEFKNVFPVADSSQAKEFSQRISDWLKVLKDGGYLEMNSISTASQLRTASGFRLVTTLLDLSTHALSALFQRLHPQATASYTFKLQTTKDLKHQQLLNELVHAAKAVALMDVRAQAQEYARISREAAAAQRREEAAAEQLRELYYSLKARHMQLCSQLDPAEAELLREMAAHEEPRPSGPAVPSAAEPTNDQSLLRSLTAAPVGPATLAPLSLSRTGPEPSAAPAPEPAALEVSELLGSLRDQLARVYAPLQQVLADVSASAPAAAAAGAAAGQRAGMVHPNAIDGAALMAAAAAAAGGAAGTRLPPPAGEAVDIVALLHRWAQGLEACVGPMCSLGGQPLPPDAAAGRHGRSPGVNPAPPLSGGGGVHPLLAPPHVSSSHAALLATQLGLQRGSLAGLRATARALAEQLGAADRRAAELGAQVWGRLNAAAPAALPLQGGASDAGAAQWLPGSGGDDMAMDLLAAEGEARAEGASPGTAWREELGPPDLAGLRVSDAVAPWLVGQRDEPVPGAQLQRGSGPPVGYGPPGHDAAAAPGFMGAGMTAPVGQDRGRAGQALASALPGPPPSSDLELTEQRDRGDRSAAGETEAGGLGPTGQGRALGTGSDGGGGLDVLGLKARLARQAPGLAAGQAAAGGSQAPGPAAGAVDVLGLKARLAQQASVLAAGQAAADGPQPLGPAGPAAGAVDVLSLKARLARQAAGGATLEAGGASSSGAGSGSGGAMDVNQIKERLARLAGRAEQAAGPPSQPSSQPLLGRPDLPVPHAPAADRPAPPPAAGPGPGAVAPPRPALSPLSLDADEGLASIWGMDVDGPSEDDIGAVLQALGCSPCVQAGLGAGAFALPRGPAPAWGGAAAAAGVQPPPAGQQRGGGGGPGGGLGSKAGALDGPSADACQGHDQGAQGGALDAQFDASARRLTFSAAVPHLR